MGVVREHNAYSAPCRTFLDGPQNNRIKFYFVPDDRPFFTGWHCFHPRIHDAFEATGLEYEKTGMRPNPRTHTSGVDYWLNPGDHVHGDAQDFLGQATVAKYLQGNGMYPDPCEETAIIVEGLQLGDKQPTEPIEKLWEGLRLGDVLVIIPPEMLLDGLALADVLDDLTPAIETFAHGLALADVLVETAAAVETLVEGLHLAGYLPGEEMETFVEGLKLGYVLVEVETVEALLDGAEFADVLLDVEPPPVEVDVDGLAFADVLLDVDATVESRVEGLALGDVLIDVGVPPYTPTESLTLGLALGNYLDTSGGSESAETLAQGLAVAGVEGEDDAEAFDEGAAVADVLVEEASPPPPGTDCGSAGDWPLGGEFTFAIGAMAHHWFKFAVTHGVTYHVKLIVNSGALGGNSVLTGSSCLSAFPEFSLNSLTPCNTFNKGSDTICYIHISGDIMGGANYTLSADVGGCP